MKQIGDWALPDVDTYFAPHCTIGFQLDHLQAAFPFVRKWDLAVDVGAHVGFWTRELASRFAVVHAVEPADDAFNCLESNVASCRNVVLRHAAAGIAAGTCTVADDPARSGNTGARFITFGGTCPVIAVDDLQLEACDLLKVDVEGYEDQVLRGAEATIAKHRPVIVMETDKRFAWSRYRVADKAAEQRLLSLGYRVAVHMRPDKVFVPN